MTRVTDSLGCPLACPGLIDTSTSTRLPGTTKPATPTTSFTLTERARIPGGMVGGSPAPAPAFASLASVSGSFSARDCTRPRLVTCSMLVNEPGMGLAEGHATSFTSSAVRRSPTGRGLRRDHGMQLAQPPRFGVARCTAT